MNRGRRSAWLLCCCLMLVLAGCGNKGPLELPEDEQKKSKNESS